jgi:ABC-type uncharacterized transport system auxiliary subunit
MLRARATVLLAATFILSGCLTQQDRSPTTYYVLEFDASVAEESAHLPVPHEELGDNQPVVIQDADVAPMYDRRQLLQRLEGPMVRYRNADLWAVSPPTAIANLVREAVGWSGLFAEMRQGRNAEGRYQILTHVDELAHYCCDEPISAHVAGAFTLVDLVSGEALLRHEFARREELSGPQPRVFVEAVTQILSEEVVVFLSDSTREIK